MHPRCRNCNRTKKKCDTWILRGFASCNKLTTGAPCRLQQNPYRSFAHFECVFIYVECICRRRRVTTTSSYCESALFMVEAVVFSSSSPTLVVKQKKNKEKEKWKQYRELRIWELYNCRSFNGPRTTLSLQLTQSLQNSVILGRGFQSDNFVDAVEVWQKRRLKHKLTI